MARSDHPYLTDEHAGRIAEWVRRLRSGTRAQMPGALVQVNREGHRVGYCCLGVATEMAEEAGVVVGLSSPTATLSNAVVVFRSADGTHSSESVLPQCVADWLGVRSQDPYVNVHRFVVHGPGSEPGAEPLTNVNDNLGLSFEQIAELIEQEFLS